MYEIVMPQLSDSMEEGKLIAWKVNPGDRVKTGDVIAEVESDKAIMEVQTFKNGTVKELLLKEGDEAPVGTVMARIEVEGGGDREQGAGKNEELGIRSEEPKKNEQRVTSSEEQNREQVVGSREQPKSGQRVTSNDEPKKDEELGMRNEEPKGDKNLSLNPQPSSLNPPSAKGATVSPKARAKAAAYGIDIDTLLTHRPQGILHAEDIDAYVTEHYFTPKALKLMRMYRIAPSVFTLDHKIESDEVRSHIEKNDIPLPKPLTPMQKAVIANVTASARKPIYHVYEHIDATALAKYEERYSMTVLLVKLFADTMMRFAHFRARLYEESMQIFPHASIAVAVADEEKLYMPVVKHADALSLNEIAEALQGFKEKLKRNGFTADDFEGSTFAISNLGMFGIERFDAMINKNDTAIAAIGATVEGKMSVTLTIDHRLINGYEAAQFVQVLKAAAKGFKE